MKKFIDELDRMVSVDVETSGPNPADYALLSIGACTMRQPRKEFYVEFVPDKDAVEAEAMRVHNLKLSELHQNGKTPQEALEKFKDWLQAILPGSDPLFVGFNAPFDWMFINDYFHHYLGENPFGHSALDVKSFLMGFRRVPWSQTSMKHLSKDALAHNALADAIAQAEIFLEILHSGGVLSDN